MQKKVHLAFGVTCALLLSVLIHASNVQTLVFCIGAYSFASVPDLDMVAPFFKHRGLSHSLILFLLVTAVSIGIPFLKSVLPAWAFYGFPIGYLSHLIADSFTETGVAWLAPYKEKRYSIGIFNTGNKLVQNSLFLLLWSLNLWMLKTFFAP